MSLEQTSDFIIIRRILRAVCPQYVIYTRTDMPPGETRIDPDHQAIILSDHTEVAVAVPAALFQIGKIRTIAKVSTAEGDLFMREMASTLNRHDRAAAAWALSTYECFWPEADAEAARKLLRTYIVSIFDWYKFINN